MDLHGASINMWLQCIECIRKRGKCECHKNLVKLIYDLPNITTGKVTGKFFT
jgi:hypothetical protein